MICDETIANLDDTFQLNSVTNQMGVSEDHTISELNHSVDPLDMHQLNQPDRCKQVTMKHISDHISKWEKGLVYDDQHYERINLEYEYLQKQLFNEAIQRGQSKTARFVYKPNVPALFSKQNDQQPMATSRRLTNNNTVLVENNVNGNLIKKQVAR